MKQMIVAFCRNCRHYRPNKPDTPIFINGFWWGGPDAGLCKRETEKYNPDQHTVESDSCEFHEFKEIKKQ